MGGISRRRWKRRGIGLRFNVLLGSWSLDHVLELKGNLIHDGTEFSNFIPLPYAIMLTMK
jgi:hypothetical protein